ncbi:MAG: hypothetical protein QOC61_1509, partial [Acidobacteriota bacterium]|nr:hypothetical protein [Acidobacteriota bacterium]
MMRPQRPTKGAGERISLARDLSDALRASLLPLLSPRSVERNYKDTTNGARLLTANFLLAWEKPLDSELKSSFERGGASPANLKYAYSKQRKMSRTFLDR